MLSGESVTESARRTKKAHICNSNKNEYLLLTALANVLVERGLPLALSRSDAITKQNQKKFC